MAHSSESFARMFRLCIAAVAVAALITFAAPATAVDGHPPKRAKVKVGRSEAGVRLGQRVRVTKRGHLRGAVVRRWGRVKYGYCFEGATCSWNIPGRGSVSIEVSRNRVAILSTTAPRWSTNRGVHPGSTFAKARSAYPAAVYRTVCLPPYGAPASGLLLSHNGSKTLFETGSRGSAVDSIYVIGKPLC